MVHQKIKHIKNRRVPRNLERKLRSLDAQYQADPDIHECIDILDSAFTLIAHAHTRFLSPAHPLLQLANCFAPAYHNPEHVSEKRRTHVDEIRSAADRAHELVQQLVIHVNCGSFLPSDDEIQTLQGRVLAESSFDRAINGIVERIDSFDRNARLYLEIYRHLCIMQEASDSLYNATYQGSIGNTGTASQVSTLYTLCNLASGTSKRMIDILNQRYLSLYSTHTIDTEVSKSQRQRQDLLTDEARQNLKHTLETASPDAYLKNLEEIHKKIENLLFNPLMEASFSETDDGKRHRKALSCLQFLVRATCDALKNSMEHRLHFDSALNELLQTKTGHAEPWVMYHGAAVAQNTRRILLCHNSHWILYQQYLNDLPHEVDAARLKLASTNPQRQIYSYIHEIIDPLFIELSSLYVQVNALY